MTGRAPDISRGVSGPEKVSLLLLRIVTSETAPGGFFPIQMLETHDFGDVSATFNVRFARAVATLASLVRGRGFLVQHSCIMRCLLKMFGEIFVARLTSLGTNVI